MIGVNTGRLLWYQENGGPERVDYLFASEKRQKGDQIEYKISIYKGIEGTVIVTTYFGI